MRIFSKTLTKDDVQLGLTLPAATQWNLLIPEGNSGKEFRVKDAATGLVWSFQLLIRTSGRKPIFSGGWLEFVHHRGLQPGDKVTLYSSEDEATEVQYIIKVQLELTSFLGRDMWVDSENTASMEAQPNKESMVEAYPCDLSNDSHYPIDFLSALGSSSENRNADVFYDSSTREDIDTHLNTELSLSLLPKTEHIIDIKTNDENNGTHQRREVRSRKVNLEWIFVISNFVLELPSVVFDQLSSAQKPQYALISMLMSLTAMLVCIIELIYKGRKERVGQKWRDRITWFYFLTASNMYFVTFTDIVGLACAICQFIVTTINYSFAHRNADIPIKTSLWPVIFAFGLLCSKFFGNTNRKTPSLKRDS